MVAAHVGVEQPDLEPLSRVDTRKEGCQILPHLPGWVAHSVDHRPLRLIGEDWEALDLRAEADTARWQVQPGLPAVQRVVVAVADEGTNAGPVQLSQPFDEAKLGTEAPVSPIVDVAGNQQGIDLFLEAEVGDVPVCFEGGTCQRVGHVGRDRTADALEGAVQVQVGRVDEAESGHGHLVL